MTRATLGVLLATATAGYVTQRNTYAIPAFATKEGVSCGYCHNRAAGGGPRNYRGRYYGRNKQSFENFDDYAAAVGAGKDVAPGGEQKAKSQTTPAPVTEAHNKVVAAQKAHEAKPDDADLKKAYVDSLTDLSKTLLDAKSIPAKARFTAVQQVAKDTLGLDPSNETAKAQAKTAEDGLKAEEEKEKAKAAGDGAAPKPANP